MGSVSRQRAVVVLRVLWPVAVMAILLAAAPDAQAKIYKYRDKWGMTHVVDSPAKVPPEYKDQVKTEEGSDSSGYRLQQPSGPIAPAQGRPQAGGAPSDGSSPAADAKKKRCEREVSDQNTKIAALRKKADAWTEEEMNRNCGDASRTKEGGCYYISSSGGMRDMLGNLRQEAEAKNPYRRQVADEELRLKKIEGECR